MKTIILTGGGTAGHVTPLIALLPMLKQDKYDIHYIGSKNGIEKKLIKEHEINYYSISSGKLRRYLDWRNFTDPFRVLKGYFQAKKLIKKLKPDIVFSKGGFVTVPVVLAAKSRKVPVIIHESDISPGLANKIAIPFAKIVCANFPETLNYLPKEKAYLTGTPIRSELFTGNKSKGLDFCNFKNKKATLLMIGGSTGSQYINNVLRQALDKLLVNFQIIHLCGKGNTDESLRNTPNYAQFEYVNKELKDLFAAADIVISRAGANVICELLALKKPNILIPLPQDASRGDQILNANSFKKSGYSFVLPQENLTLETLYEAVNSVYKNKSFYISKMETSTLNDSIASIISLIKEYSL